MRPADCSVAVRLCRLKNLQVPEEVVSQIVATLREDQKIAVSRLSTERTRLDSRLTAIRNRMDAAHTDKLDGKIEEDFWERKMTDWRAEEQQVKMAIQGLAHAETSDRALDAQRILEPANNAYSLYVSQNPAEKAKLLKNAIFELLCRRRKCLTYIQKALRHDRQKGSFE